MSSVESYRKPANIWDLKPRRKREDRADSSASDRTQSVEVDNTTSRSDKLPRDSSGSRLKDIAGTWLVEKEEEEEEEEESLNNAPESSRTAPTAQTSPRRRSELPISPARKEPVTRAAKRKPSSNLQTESPKRVVTGMDSPGSV